MEETAYRGLHAQIQSLSTCVPGITSNEDSVLRERVVWEGGSSGHPRSSVTSRIEYLTNVPMHCEIVPVQAADVCMSSHPVEEALGCLCDFRQTIFVPMFCADEEERPAVAPDPHERTESKPGICISQASEQAQN
jgi:hypothetical protein